MADLVEFLTARYDDVEAAMRVKMTSRRMINGKMVAVPLRENPRAWALPPSVVLAEVKAKRRILELHHLVPWSRVEQVPGPIVIDDPDNGRDFCNVCETAHPRPSGC